MQQRNLEGITYEGFVLKSSGKESKIKRIIPGDNPGITVLVMKELY